MLLGSGELGKEVLIALQRLGVETIAVDRYDGAPGQQVAHHARTITMSDPAALRALIEAEKPMLVVPEIEAIATPALQAMEAEGLVRVIPTARAARLTMDREGIRRLAAETLGLPTSPYKFCDSLAELQAAIDGGRHRLPLHRQAGDEQLGQGPEQDRRPGRCAESLGLRDGRRARQPRPRDRRRFHRFRLRDHPAHRARGAGHAVLRAHRPRAGERRLRRKLAAAPHAPGRAGSVRSRSRRPSPTTWAATACSASSCSSRAMRSGSARSARARTTPAW